ncbi:MAG: molybdopterin-dependent oxidoreductase [Gemmatimonadota bacterium]|nr:MAG: molybdopterin-dependent oxidoreductase [Gemmatimonadota bacterium]
MPVYSTACPRNCYSTCSMRVEIEDGRLRRVEPHPDNRATPEGACLKGLSYVERVHSPDRILHPLRRKAGTAEFERIPWDEAIDLIVSNLMRIKDELGPQSVLYYAGSGTKGLLNAVGMEFWKLYGGCTTTYGDLCWPAGLEATRLTLGENKHNAPWDLANAKLIVMWGKNAAETNIHQMVFVDEALDSGARLVVIDPRRTQTSERAELLIQPRPGTDGALALSIAHLLIANGHVDRPFVERHVLGFEEFAASVSEFTPAKAAEISDVPVDYIHRLAQLMGTTSPMTVSAGFGMQRYTNSGQTMRAILALLAITGNIGKPGAGWVYANLQSHIFDAVKDPLAFYPPENPGGGIRVSISTALLGRHMLATRDPPLRMAWVERGNPVTQNPETRTVLEAFRALEFRVVVDQFLTDTAREADLVLPAKTMFEQSDVIGAYWHPYIQLKQKVMDPPGEVKPESEVYYLLARRLGFDEREMAGRIPEPGDEAIERFLKGKLEPFAELSPDRLREGPVLAPGHQEVAFSDYLFPTPSGKIELVSAEAARRWNAHQLPVYVEPDESARRGSRESEEFPLYLLTPNTKNRIHSQFNNLKMIQLFGDKPFLLLNPRDARERNIDDGDVVKVFNRRGAIRVAARLDNGIKAGCVLVTNGWWITEGGTVNFCSYGRETDMGYGAAFHDNLVEVKLANE